MRKILTVIALLAFLPLPALAADAAPPTAPVAAEPPKFVPFEIDEKTYGAIVQYFQDKPYSIAAPMVATFQMLERQAQANAAAKK